MKKYFKSVLMRLINTLNYEISKNLKDEREILAIGSLLSKQSGQINSTNINDHEFRIFSQWGDDGIIQYLTKNLRIDNKIFIEFGVENYLESNTRFLMMNDNWEGFIMDGSAEAMEFVKKQNWYWRHSLHAKAVFITKENINTLLRDTGYRNIGLLHIDIDGNDYHVLESIELERLNPSIIITEYNGVFGNKRPISTPYDKDFNRTEKHFSNLYFGASLPAFHYLLSKKNYALVGCNIAGNNAHFVRRDLLNEKVKEVQIDQAFKMSKFRESRNPDFSFSFLEGDDRLKQISGLEVVNVVSGEVEFL